MRPYFILDRRAHGTPTALLREVAERLRAAGMEPELGIPEEAVLRCDLLAPAHDLYLLKSYTELGLGVARLLHVRGARLLNPYSASAVLHSRLATAQWLYAAGLPTPRTWATGDLSLLLERPWTGALVVKPLRGLHGAGVRVVRDPRQLLSETRRPGGWIVQEHVAGDGEDLKLYVAGEFVFGVRKAFSSDSFSAPGRPCEVSDGLRELALRCGRALGLGLYGLDLVVGPEGPVVVDVNYFPGYRGVPDAAAAVAGYIEGYARGSVPPLEPRCESLRARSGARAEHLQPTLDSPATTTPATAAG